jgi:hypothetical protein
MNVNAETDWAAERPHGAQQRPPNDRIGVWMPWLPHAYLQRQLCFASNIRDRVPESHEWGAAFYMHNPPAADLEAHREQRLDRFYIAGRYDWRGPLGTDVELSQGANISVIAAKIHGRRYISPSSLPQSYLYFPSKETESPNMCGIFACHWYAIDLFYLSLHKTREGSQY